MHIPVLTKEVLEYLDPKPGENFIDCTLGQGGHAKLILEKTSPTGKLLGIDYDQKQIKISKNNLADYGSRLIAENDSYANLEEVVKRNNFGPVNGILLDIGMSSYHPDESGRGFSFTKDEPLDMRYNTGGDSLTAYQIVNTWNEEDIESILRDYGEERFSRKIAREIIAQRKVKKIETTGELVKVIGKVVRQGKIHFATRTFQALRIAVNRELDNLTKVLPQVINILATNGRLVIISFHSLEDRIVKNYLRDLKKENRIEILTKKPVIASMGEIRDNPRSRSAKLRAVIKN